MALVTVQGILHNKALSLPGLTFIGNSRFCSVPIYIKALGTMWNFIGGFGKVVNQVLLALHNNQNSNIYLTLVHHNPRGTTFVLKIYLIGQNFRNSCVQDYDNQVWPPPEIQKVSGYVSYSGLQSSVLPSDLQNFHFGHDVDSPGHLCIQLLL